MGLLENPTLARKKASVGHPGKGGAAALLAVRCMEKPPGGAANLAKSTSSYRRTLVKLTCPEPNSLAVVPLDMSGLVQTK